MKSARGGAALAAMVACGCSTLDPRVLPPFGEALVVVDTDLPVPLLAGRLRVDFFAEDGTWFDSRDVARPDPGSFPASFGVYADDETRDKLVWVRLRVYPEGRTRDYRGERFADWGDPKAAPPPDEGPRLLRGGMDETPPAEPEPLVSVDRLLLFRLRPGLRGRALVTLRGECAGTMAKLGGAAPTAGAAESCVDTERQRAIVGEEPIEDTLDLPTTSLAGTWGAEPCPVPAGAPAGGRVCVPGGATILGSSELLLFPQLAPVPERAVRLSRFWVDRDEVTVGRYRAALAAGFAPAHPPTANDGALGATVDTACSWTSAAGKREGYGLSCITWAGARELCQHLGGDLPSEAQWEYLATTAGRGARTRFAWGDAPPSCDRAVYGRIDLGGIPGVCQSVGSGPRPIAEGDADVSGAVGLGGGLAEWTRDAYQDYAGACWQKSSNADPGCFATSAKRSLRGGSWAAPPATLRGAMRLGSLDGGSSFEGFRCVYPSPAP